MTLQFSFVFLAHYYAFIAHHFDFICYDVPWGWVFFVLTAGNGLSEREILVLKIQILLQLLGIKNSENIFDTYLAFNQKQTNSQSKDTVSL